MKLGLLLASVGFCAATASLACAAGDVVEDGSKAYQSCVAKSGYVDQVLADCAMAEYEREDQRLNAVYSKLMARLGEKDRTKLRDEERAWIASRDHECDQQYELEAGHTIAPLMYASCLRRQTRLRSEELDRLLTVHGSR